MLSRIFNLEGWHATAPKLARGVLRILTIPALALLLFGADPPKSAQAAPAGEPVRFFMVAIPSENYVCVKQSMTFRVYVDFAASPDPLSHVNRLSGVPVDATVADRNIGTITPDRLSTGFDTYDPEVAEFTFTAGNDPGTTTIYFEGLITRYTIGSSGERTADQPIYVDFPAQVEVRKCEYEVSVLYMAAYPGVMAWTGTSDETKLNADSDTHFSGTSNFQYTQGLLFPVPFCETSITVIPTTIDYQADLFGNMLKLSIVIKDTTNVFADQCSVAGFSFGTQAQGQMGKRMFDVIVPSAGGMARKGPEGPTSEVFMVFVTRNAEEAAPNL